ncbi:MAG: glycosyltransferase family 2 protein [Planctomycetes bacterium]|nr:glycosyltransferase family 2 protein [Planctomycetota bacterium]
MTPDVSVVVLSWNTQQLLRECLAALRCGHGGLNVEVVVVDNASHDGSADMVAREFPEIRLQRNSINRGYAGGVNDGIALAQGASVLLLGSDTRVAPDALRRLHDFLKANPKAGAVAPRLINPDGSIQRACMRFPSLRTVLWWDTPLQHFFPEGKELRSYQMKEWDHRGTRRVDQPPGTCLLVPRAVIDRVGVMDEQLWLFFNDVDWSLRMTKAGYELWYLDEAEVVHHLGGSTRHYVDFAAEWHRNRIRFYRKHFHSLGVLFTKTALLYVGLRQCVRVKRHLPFGAEYKANVKQIFGLMRGVLRV